MNRADRSVDLLLSDVNRQVDVGSAWFFILCVFKGKTDDFVHAFRTDYHLGALGDWLKNFCQVQKLMGSQMHPFRADLAGDSNERSAV